MDSQKIVARERPKPTDKKDEIAKSLVGVMPVPDQVREDESGIQDILK